jgi:four helix bundle protein
VLGTGCWGLEGKEVASTIKSYRDLEVWQLAMKLAELCYEQTAHFPARETYGLVSQIRRAAVSVASNIAEGHSRRTLQAYLNHLSIALGSQAELETQIELSRRLNLLPDGAGKDILQMAGQVGRMLHALIASLEQRGG